MGLQKKQARKKLNMSATVSSTSTSTGTEKTSGFRDAEGKREIAFDLPEAASLSPCVPWKFADAGDAATAPVLSLASAFDAIVLRMDLMLAGCEVDCLVVADFFVILLSNYAEEAPDGSRLAKCVVMKFAVSKEEFEEPARTETFVRDVFQRVLDRVNGQASAHMESSAVSSATAVLDALSAVRLVTRPVGGELCDKYKARDAARHGEFVKEVREIVANLRPDDITPKINLDDYFPHETRKLFAGGLDVIFVERGRKRRAEHLTNASKKLAAEVERAN